MTAGCGLAALFYCADMNQNTAEGIVRRATAAFNAGQRDEASKLCEQGLRRQPGEPMLLHVILGTAPTLDDDSKIGRSDSVPESMEIAGMPGARWHCQ